MAVKKKDVDAPQQTETFHGEWKCASCSSLISELPFQPREGSQVYCKNCWQDRRNSATRRFQRGQRQTFQGDWKCSECGTTINELPFQPAEDRPIYCRECWAKKRS